MSNADPNVNMSLLERIRLTDANRQRALLASAAKIEANRANAQKSTGPRTDAGKQASSRNAIKHGLFSATLLLPKEDPEQYAALCERYLDGFQPQGIEEENLVEEMIVAKWKQARLNVVEQGVYAAAERAAIDEEKPTATLSEIQLEVGGSTGRIKDLDRVSQLQARLARDYHRALKELRACRKKEKPRSHRIP